MGRPAAILAPWLLAAGVCSAPAQADSLVQDSLYTVSRVSPEGVTIDGRVDDAAWQNAPVLSSEFHYPWREESVPNTRFQALWDDQYLYFVFVAHDADIVALDQLTQELDIGNEDRVELFFAPGVLEQPVKSENGTELPRYYGIEIDPKGRVLDFSAQYHRKFDFDWTMPGLDVVASDSESRYQVEARIPLQTLRTLGLLSAENTLMAGVFRGEFSHTDAGLVSRWISWVNPQVPQPDFHVSSAFGLFRLTQ
ncbi:carbohydrate-binding family 9-like protein [Porticoccus sp. GXU_MW_L64]